MVYNADKMQKIMDSDTVVFRSEFDGAKAIIRSVFLSRALALTKILQGGSASQPRTEDQRRRSHGENDRPS